MMKAAVSTIKIVILITLIVISVYQTSRLWFDDQSDPNLFYRVFSSSTIENLEAVRDAGNMITPKQLGVYLGQPNLEYTIVKKGIPHYETLRSESIKILIMGLDKDYYVGVVENKELLWSNQHTSIHMDFPLEQAIFARNLGISQKALEGIGSVDTILIMPAFRNEIWLNIFLEDPSTGLYHHYQVPKSEVVIANDSLAYQLSNVVANGSRTSFISTLKNNIPYYSKHLLLPLPSEDNRYHDPIFTRIPFVSDAAVNVSELDGYVSLFFDNPDIMKAIPLENEVRYVDGNVVVRYNTEGLVEYNRIVKENAGSTSLTLALTVANQFIEQDIQRMPTEYFLKTYLQEAQRTVFYYDIGFNDYPFVLTEEVKQKYGMSHAIEVTVSGDKVIKYRRILRKIDDMNPQNKTLQAKYENVLDKVILEAGTLDVEIEEMYLGYSWNRDMMEMSLNWVVQYDGSPHFYPVE
ncbi:hypothetical protein [Petrocella sp. FN5]|uniref:hypothetical protein n=1 Tax=Petrocella sp. FN5 TaxID=3032002 RepID=UPI0023DB9DAA|nr:hypothetical protein [Petrocella sp. FN5]MDF1616444.1 hypothetical protein [Petrocella sp. FN5]